MNRTRIMAVVCSIAFTALLGGCGGGNNAGNAKISGSVSGLAAGSSVSLTNNGGTPLVISSNGNFTFSGTVSSNNTYDVVVSSQPVGSTGQQAETCLVTYGTGIIDYSGSDINNVSVICSSNISVGVQVTGGLNSGNQAIFSLTLQNDAGNTYYETVSTNGTTSNFSPLLPLGALYNVAVAAQPGQQLVQLVVNGVPQVLNGKPVYVAQGNATQTCAVSSTTTSPYSGGVVSSTPIVVDFNCH